MKKIYGVIPTNEGDFVMATLEKTPKGWQKSQIKQWGIQDTFKNTLLLDKGVFLGLNSSWLRHSAPEYTEMKMALSDNEFVVCTRQGNYNLYSNEIENNLLGVYPEDAYLSTIPLFMISQPLNSFVTLAKEDSVYKIGITINRRLNIVFTIIAEDLRQLQGHFARIKRYWFGLRNNIPFPETTYILNIPDISLDEIINIRHITLPDSEITVLKATGIALCGVEPIIPRFSGPTAACRFKSIRTLTYALSSILFVSTLLILLSVIGYNHYLKTNIAKCNEKYNEIIAKNKEIGQLLNDGDLLAEKFWRMESFASQQTNWAKLLHFIGMKRQKGLFIEKMGSDPSANGANVRILFMGWSANDNEVTDLIRKLNTSEIVSDVKLTSLEREEKNLDFCKFKIICLLKLPVK
jgi:hypothetical protein